jgi:acetyl-CoA carboxylase biotin carboxyl carrier protein
MTTQKKQAKQMENDSGSLLGLREIEILLETLEKHEVTEFKLEREGEKVWLKRGPQQAPQMQMPVMVPHYGAPQQGAYQAPQAPPAVAPADTTSAGAGSAGLTLVPGMQEAPSGVLHAGKNIKEIRSPMVGTFYRRPAVDAEPYVTEGDTVKKGDVLCIVEAMKLMNEIESDISGKLVEVCLEDGQMVEYGEVLFRIESV